MTYESFLKELELIGGKWKPMKNTRKTAVSRGTASESQFKALLDRFAGIADVLHVVGNEAMDDA